MAQTTIYQLKTFADIVAAVREELKIQSTDTNAINRIKRDINILYLDEVVPFSPWKWLRGNITLNTQPVFITGTCEVTQNSTTVTLSSLPGISKKGFFFSIQGFNEVYRIASHVFNSDILNLQTRYSGASNATASFKIWTDEIYLPQFVRETFSITSDFSNVPLEACGLTKFRQYVASLPKAEGRPSFYTTDSYTDEGQFQVIENTEEGLPDLMRYDSEGLLKSLSFHSDPSAFFREGDRIRISGALDDSFNGEFTVSANVIPLSETVTFTGVTPSIVAENSSDVIDNVVIEKLYTIQDDRRAKRILVYPSIYTTTSQLHIDYLREVQPLSEDADQPLMPIGDRTVLLYGALQRAWSRERNPEEASRNFQLYQQKLARMAGKADDSFDAPRLSVSKTYLGVKRQTQRRGGFNGYLSGGLSGGSGGSSSAPIINGTASHVAVYDAQGLLSSSPAITSDELAWLDNVASQVLGADDFGTFTNKTIDTADNSIENIANANISASAAIVYSKLSLSQSVKASDINSQSSPITYYLRSNGNGTASFAPLTSSDALIITRTSITGSISGSDQIVEVDLSSGDITLSLPTLATVLHGKPLTIKIVALSGGHTLTLQRSSTDNVEATDGTIGTTLVMDELGQCEMLYGNNTVKTWYRR
jgi:hypothetical protein